MSYTVFATVRVKPDFIDDACNAVAAITDQTRAETGCEQFVPTRDANGAAEIHIFEQWFDKAAFDFHHAQPYTQGVYAKYENWLLEEPVITEVKELEG